MNTANSSRITARTRKVGVAGLVCLSMALAGKPAAASSPQATKHPAAKKSVSGAKRTSSHGKSKKKTRRVRGQQKIDAERARQIQEALIREHYLSGDAGNSWNESSEAAMRHFQADHGWQTKTVPDSRALIALGLGPNQDHLLNPESAMTSVPVKSAASGPGPADNHKR